jgi:hypothetical protein
MLSSLEPGRNWLTPYRCSGRISDICWLTPDVGQWPIADRQVAGGERKKDIRTNFRTDNQRRREPSRTCRPNAPATWKLRQPGALSRLERDRRMFCRPNDDRCITTRYDKLTLDFRAAIRLAAAVNDCL